MMANATGSTSGTGVLNGACRSASDTAPENTLWWTTCPNFTAQRFHATSCNAGTTYDITLYQRSANRASEVCVDDSNFTCSNRSTITSDLPAGSGLHALYVDGGNAASGSYVVTHRLGSCAPGYMLCGSECFETMRLQTDNSNCGACGSVCGTGTSCSAGVCGPCAP